MNHPDQRESLFSCFTTFIDKEVVKPHFYRPQRSCGQGYVFTRVCDSVNGGGVSASVHAWKEAPHRKSASVHAGLRHTPPRADTTPWSRHPPEQTPPGADTPLLGSRLRHTVNERPVRILLECILVK